MTAIETFKPQLTNQKDTSPVQTEAFDLLMAGAKAAGCARPQEPHMLDFSDLGQGAGGGGKSHPGSEKIDHVDGSKGKMGDSQTVTHRKDHGCALPSNPEVLDFNDLGGGGGAKGPGKDQTVKDTDTETVTHKNLDFDIENLKTPVQKNPPHELNGVCFTPTFDKPHTQPPKMRDLPAPAWAPLSK